MLLHYLGNQKEENFSFHLNAECWFANRHTKHICIITWSQPLYFICTRIDHMHQTKPREYSMLSSVTTQSSFTKSVMMLVAVPKVEVVLWRVWSEKFTDSIGGISYYVNKCWRLSNMHQRMVHAKQFSSCCAKVWTSFLLNYGPNMPELNSTGYKI